MTTEALFTERWKELESVTHLSFPTWDGRDIEKVLKQMRVEGVDFTRLKVLHMARNAFAHNPMLNGRLLITLNGDISRHIGCLVRQRQSEPR